MSIVKIENLKKSYGCRQAVNNLSLELHDGELFALLGSSGCGKTTTLRCLAGLEEFDAGSITVDGQDISQVPACDRGFGMVFQNYALFPHLSIRDNTAYGLLARRYRQVGLLGKAAVLWRSISGSLTSQDKEIVEETLKMVELSDCAHRLPSQLSGGQQQRAALARALVTRPRVLLFDEPLGALDVKLRIKMREEIRNLQRQAGITALYVTHDQEEAFAVSDRLALMDQGQIIQIGRPEEIYAAPVNKFAAEFIGFVNIFPALVNAELEGQIIIGDNLSLYANNLSSGVNGSKIYAAVRPDNITILPIADNKAPSESQVAPSSQENISNKVSRFQAVVQSRVFMGSFIKYTVKCAEQSFVVNVPMNQLKNQQLLEIGAEATIEIKASDVVLVDC
ncbi:MAG: ABC transporter ATP-binding protein [Candidatus Bruticola sp.]